MRIPMMPKEPRHWVTDDDVIVRTAPDPPLVGRRLKVVIDEAILAQVGARALEEAVKRAGYEFALQHQHEIQSQCMTLLANPEWVKPILEDELRQAAREMLMTLWSDDEKKALRDWFDLLAAKGRSTGLG